MEHQNLINASDTTNMPKFNAKKCVEANDQSGGTYGNNTQIRFETSTLRSNFCDFSDVYIVVKGTIAVDGTANINKYDRKLVLKNFALFTSCISKINNTFNR